MSGIDIVKRLATGILDVAETELASGRLGLVGVRGEAGLELLRGVPDWASARLVAVRLTVRTRTRRHWRGPGRTVRTITRETPVVLGEGAVHTATTDPSGLPDLVGIRPDGDHTGPWLSLPALTLVCGKQVRLELHRPPETRGTNVPRDRSA